jgi:exopolyphosphatase / guanosine-5'-triphosphate,3'-diphosphate pyrophosphatase
LQSRQASATIPSEQGFWYFGSMRTALLPGAQAVFETAGSGSSSASGSQAIYGALDLGTNNCRLLMARPSSDGFRVVDAFSRIVRLGEGLSSSQALGEPAIERTIEALKICRDKMDRRGVTRARLIATEACRSAKNGLDFVARVEEEIGLTLEIIDRETEAMLAASGCAALADPAADSVVLFDIGGGSTEVVWLDQRSESRSTIKDRIREWSSLPVGVVTLAERHGGRHVTPSLYQKMIAEVRDLLGPLVAALGEDRNADAFHLLGTSGTVTTIAGVHLGLPRYDRRAVDGLWMSSIDVDGIVDRLLGMTYEERVASACIGTERADLVLSGCAIFDAIRAEFPSDRVRVADRGLREGILMQLMVEDGVWTGAGGLA